MKNIKPDTKLSTIFTLFTFILLFTTSCSEQQPIKIAYLGASSGQNSEVVVSVRNSVKMYIDRLNSEGGVKGRQIELVSFDNKLDTSLAAQLFDQIIEEDYKFVLGPIFSQMAEVTLEKTTGKDILVMSPSMSSNDLTGKNDNIFRVCVSNTEQSKTLAEHIIAKGYKRLAVVLDTSNAKYTEPLFQQTWNIVKEEGVKLVKVKAYQKSNSVDMYPIAQEILQDKPDVLLFCTSAIDAASLAQQLRKFDNTIDFVGSSWSQTNDLIEQGGRSVNGMVLVSIDHQDKANERYKTFEKQFAERYGHAPSFPAILGYNAVDVLVKGMQKAAKLTPASVKKAILDQKQFSGLTHSIVFDQYGDVEGDHSMVVVEDGKFTTIQQ